ncbi:HobA family DNA replication regulator [uncultured Campylobacter sp.]|uniref:HobA family DNA replication regulator n=1 Tax=uncultured Campylobacter sp. TaxID=218934 RepID=UPI00262A7D89|nr:HobA family DNA replication regulator [uncultured Campylobacter sp.]
MQDLYTWSLGAIRSDSSMSWIEDKKEDWTPLLASRMKLLLDGYTFLVFCDDERSWLEDYIIKSINRPSSQRPLLPFFSLKSIYPWLDSINTNIGMELLNDMLHLAFPNGFVYFYVGRGNYALSQIAKNKDDSYMWLIGENAPNSFALDAKDESLDAKLLSLFALFDKSISAILFDEVVV